MKKQAATDIVLESVRNEIRNEATLDCIRNPETETAHRGVIIHTEATAVWAEHIEREILSHDSSVFPQGSFTISRYEVSENKFTAYNDLMDHPTLFSHTRKPSFIVTPGYWETALVDSAFSTTRYKVPHFYCLQGPLDHVNLRSHESSQQRTISGVSQLPMPAHEYIAALQGLIPSIKRICIVRESDRDNALVAQRIEEMRAICEHESIEVIEHIWDVDDMREGVLASKLDMQLDAVVVLEGSAIDFHRHKIIALCNAKKVLLCASELDTVIAGAGLGAGLTNASYAIPLTRMITVHFLLHYAKILPEPYVIPQQPGMRYNMKAIDNQGVILTPQQSAMVRMQSVFDLDVIKLS